MGRCFVPVRSLGTRRERSCRESCPSYTKSLCFSFAQPFGLPLEHKLSNGNAGFTPAANERVSLICWPRTCGSCKLHHNTWRVSCCKVAGRRSDTANLFLLVPCKHLLWESSSMDALRSFWYSWSEMLTCCTFALHSMVNPGSHQFGYMCDSWSP